MIIDEITLMAWIADWETDGVEFKRTINLESKDDKGEFVKDVIALANSAPSTQDFTGYLIVGVDNDRMIVGTDPLEEERIQQVVSSYVHPRLSLRCSTLSTQAPGWPQVSTIEVKGLDRPYSISRAIGKWQQGDVFVRNGSVVSKATKEDIVRMSVESQGTAEVRQYVKAGQKQVELGNFLEAVETYSSALRLLPSAGLYLARGQARRLAIQCHAVERDKRARITDLAIKDLSDALALANSFSLQKEARFERVRLHNLTFVSFEDLNADYEWLLANTVGQEYGEALFRHYWALEGNLGITGDDATSVLTAMETALDHGFSDVGVFQLKARAKFELHDCNLALQDINKALEMTSGPEIQLEILGLKANILARMRRFEEAYETFRTARRLSSNQLHRSYTDPFGYVADELEDEILWRYALEAEFSSPGNFPSGRYVVAALLHYLGLHGGYVFDPNNKSIHEVSGVDATLNKYRKILPSLKKIVGEDFWNRWRSGRS